MVNYSVSICLLFLLLPRTLAQCNCQQGSIGLDLVLIVDIDSASLANPFHELQPLDYVCDIRHLRVTNFLLGIFC
jgi:hypothetical protein